MMNGWKVAMAVVLMGAAALAAEVGQEKPEPPVVDVSLERAQKVTDQDPLILAIVAKDAEAIRRVLKEGAALNHKTRDGSYPIIVASVYLPAPMMTILTAYGVQVDVADAEDRTALHYSAMQGDLEKVKLLTAMKAPVDPLDRFGMTPLFYAYLGKHLPVADYLMNEAGAKINAVDTQGHPVAAAAIAQQGEPEVVNHMIAAGLNLFRRDAAGNNIVAAVEKAGNKDAAALLQQAYDQKLNAFIDEQQKQAQ